MEEYGVQFQVDRIELEWQGKNFTFSFKKLFLTFIFFII